MFRYYLGAGIGLFGGADRRHVGSVNEKCNENRQPGKRADARIAAR